jgi:hypothetical protein
VVTEGIALIRKFTRLHALQLIASQLIATGAAPLDGHPEPEYIEVRPILAYPWAKVIAPRFAASLPPKEN